MSSAYPEYDPSECEVPPPSRSCFRALINGGQTAKTSNHHGGAGGSSNPDKEVDQNNSRYGLLHQQASFAFDDSFFSEGTSKTDNSSLVKMKNKVSAAMCRKTNGRGGSGGGGGGNASDARTTVSRNSHRGLLDGSSSYVSKSGGSSEAMDVIDRKDALTWKTTRTATNSSVASSSHRSRISRKSGAFPTGYDSFDFVEVDDIQRRSIGKSLAACVGLKKVTNAREKGKDRLKHREIVVDKPLPPAIPGSPQFFKFHNALPSHTVQNNEFPQIIFANDVDDDDVNNNYFGDDGFNRENNEFRSRGGDEGLTSPGLNKQGLYMDTTRGPFLDQPNGRSPSPVRRSSRKSFDFSNASPRSKGSRSRSVLNSSPRSNRSRKEEEQFLDHLANALTAYNSYQKDINQQPSNGRAVLNSLMKEIEPPHIPDVVGVENGTYYEDEFSEVGMASTSGGTKDASNDEITPLKLDYHDVKHKEANDYFDPTINQGKKANDGVAPSKLMNVDERSLKWRLREADKQNSNNNLLGNTQRCSTRELMETGKSLMDIDSSAEEFDVSNFHPNEEVDPTYAFGGSGIRKPPLALSEAFEDFGIDDRIYARKHRPGDTFDDDDEDRNVPQQRRGNAIVPMQKGTDDFQDLHSPNINRARRSPPRSRNDDDDDKRISNLMNVYVANHHNNERQGGVDNDDDKRRANLMSAYMANHHDTAHQDSNRDERSEGNDDKRRANLMNKYVTNHHDLHQDSNQDEGSSGYEDTRRANLMKAYVANHHALQQGVEPNMRTSKPSLPLHNQRRPPRDNAMKKTYDISDAPLPKAASTPRSSKYREINGSAYFSGSASTNSMQTPKWSNMAENIEKSSSADMMSTSYDMVDGKGNRRHSPQSIAEFNEQWES